MTETRNPKTIEEKVTELLKDQITHPTIPVDIFLIEVENLFNYATKDKDLLVANGLDANLIDELPPAIALLQDRQSQWIQVFNGKSITLEEWANESKDGYNLQRELQHVFKFAYRKDAKLLAQVNRIADGSGHADMVQDLSDYAVIGKANPEPLNLVKFDLTKLDKADEYSHSLRTLLGKVNGIRKNSDKEEKEMRDRAYTYLKNIVDEIRDFGKYTFWEDEAKMKLYTSEYHRKKREKQETTPEV